MDDTRFSFHLTERGYVKILCHDCGDLMIVNYGDATRLRREHPNDCWKDEQIEARRDAAVTAHYSLTRKLEDIRKSETSY